MVVAKIEKEIDLDWDDIVDLLGLDCSADHLRKISYGIREGYVNRINGQIKNVEDDLLLQELESKKWELQKERKRFFDQRRELNKINTNEARFDHMLEQLKLAADKLNLERPLNFNKEITNYSNNEALLVFSDWHYGLVTDNIWNKYNTEICKERVEKLVSKTKEHIKLHKPSVLHVALLGDSSHGSIHCTCRVASEEDTCDQIMNVAEIMAQAIGELSKYVDKVYVYSTYGNHLRTMQNKKESIHSDNMEKIIPWWMKQRFNDGGNIEIVSSDYYEFMKIKIFDYNICCSHGDLDKIRNFGVTANTIFSKLYGETIDYAILADKHHIEEFEQFGIESILVRSLCGVDEYANTHRLYSNAGQTLMFFTEEDGRLATYNIKLS